MNGDLKKQELEMKERKRRKGEQNKERGTIFGRRRGNKRTRINIGI